MNRAPHPSRRTFLKTAAAAAVGSAAMGLRGPGRVLAAQGSGEAATDEIDFIQPRPARLDLWGRITWAGYPIRETPGLDMPVVEFLPENHVLPLLETLEAEGSNPNNKLWYRIKEGYLYTSGVQAIHPYRTPQQVTEIATIIDDAPGFWAEVIVPYTIPRSSPNGVQVHDEFFGQRRPVTYFYGSVHRVIDLFIDDEDNLWYEIFDDKPERPTAFAIARHLRPLEPADFEPISPGVDKHMVVTLSEGRIDCYEGDEIVYSTLTSSGAGGFGTPTGDHAVVFKQPSRHMYSDPDDPVSGGDAGDDFFDLPGVPFNTFFTTLGHAIHGTWWHGDYGRPRSHGCLNVTPQDARWIYRWVEPFAGYGKASEGSSRKPGTPITVQA